MEKQQRDNKIKMLFRKHTRTQNSKPKVLTSEQKKTQIKKWTTFYRKNIDKFETISKNYVTFDARK